MYPVWWGLRDTLVPLDSTYASPGPPKMKTKIWKNVHQITSIFYILLSFGVILRCLWGFEAYIYNVYEFCWPMNTDLGWPGDTFAVAGDRAILVLFNLVLSILICFPPPPALPFLCVFILLYLCLPYLSIFGINYRYPYLGIFALNCWFDRMCHINPT